MKTSEPRDPRVSELERRIEELEASDEASFGHFGTWDWALCIAFGLVLPVLVVWYYAP